MSAKKNLVEDIYPLTPAQAGMLFHALHAPESGTYVLQVSGLLEGDLDADAFERAWQAVLDRHTILRTAFVADKRDEPFQVVYRTLKLAAERLDWRGLDAGQQEQELRDLLDRERARGFDPARPPLMRTVLIQESERGWRFVWTHHHLILDGWSRPAVLREVFAAYEALRTGQPVDARPVRPFRDYVQWLQRQDRAAAEAYWRRALQGFRAPVRLGREPEAGAETPALGETLLDLTAAETAALQDFARGHELTLYTLLQAAWGLLLSRAGGAADVVFGAVTSGRPADLPGAERMVGMFINTLPVRLRIDGGAALLPWLRELQAAQLEQRSHEHAPLAQVQAWSEVPRGVALFESILDFVNYPVADSLRQEGGSLRIADVRHWEKTNFPLVLVAMPGPALRLSLAWDPRRFDARDAERLLGQLTAILRRLPENSERHVEDLAPLDPVERHLLLHEWNDTALELPSDMTLHGLFLAQAERTPDAVALVFEGEELTYGELARRANALADHLVDLGVGPDTPVGLCVHRSPRMLVGLLAILQAGGAYVPMDPAYPSERLAWMLTDSGAPLLLTEKSLATDLEGLSAARIICLDREGGGAPSPGGRGSDGRGGQGVRSLAYVIYTSGSTGRPKGVGVHHRAIVNFLISMAAEPGLTADDVLVAVTTLSFDIAGLELFLPLAVGARVVLAPREVAADGSRLSRLLAESGATAMQATPSTWRLLLDAAWEPAPGFAALCGGEALPAELATELTGRCGALWNLYGPTETTVWSAARRIAPGASVTLGRAIANTGLYVVDPELRLAPAGQAGELWIGGEGVARGYLGRPELTAERFVPDPFGGEPGARLYRTGDLVRWLLEGELEYLGRIDHQVKIRGFRIELGEIETALAAHPAVRQAVVVARQEASGQKRLVAWLVPAGDREPASAELRAFLAARLPEHMVPLAFAVIDEMPLTPNGKVDRKALAQGNPGAGAGLEADWVPPSTPVEKELADLWAGVLRVERVGVHDNFFELGGDSILSLQVISRASRAGLTLTPRQLFDHPTVAALAALLAARSATPETEPAAPAVPVLAPLDESVRASLLAADAVLEDIYPLAPVQQGLLFHALHAPGEGAYVQQISCALVGDLDVDAFGAAWRRVVARHSILRTRFLWEGLDAPLQAVAREVQLPVERADWSAEPEERRAELLEALLAEDRGRGFDPSREPLMRLTLIDLGSGSWRVVWSHHHILLDGWSVPRVLTQVFALYERLRWGDAGEPEAPRPYRDFIDWLARQDAAGAEAFWRDALAGFTAPTPLAVDRPRGESPILGGERETRLPARLTGALRGFARQNQVTLNTLLQGAWALLLARYSGEEDVVFGGVTSGRPADLPGSAEMIGLFINTLPVRARAAFDAPLVPWLRELQSRGAAQRQHEHTPLAQVQGWSEVQRGLPLFESLLDFVNYPVEEALAEREESLRIDEVRFVEKTGYPLTLIALPGRQMRLRALFDGGHLDGATVERLLGHLTALLEGMAEAGAERELGSLDILPEAERRQVLEGWNDTAMAWDAPGTALHELIEAQVDRTPEAVAVVFEGQSLTYRALDEQANRLAHRLRRLGAGPGVTVGVYLERSAEMVVSLLGILKAGAAYLPLDPGYPRERITAMVEDSRTPVVLINGTTPEGLAATALDWERDRAEIFGESAARPGVALDPLDLAYVIFTSGSTGRPKGAMNTHGAIRSRLLWMQDAFGLTAADRVLQKTPFSFDVSVWEFFWPLLTGARLVVARPGGHQDPAYLAEAIEREGITTLHFVPSMLQAFVSEAPAERCASLRRVICSGEALPFDLTERFFARSGAELHNLYGPTEAAVDVTWWPCEPGDVRGLVPIGRAIANTRLYVVDRELRPVPVGVAGELWLGGIQLARGYLGRPELTAGKFVPDPFSGAPGERAYRTGDLVRWLADGTVEYLGRIDHQVKVRGFRIELGEIEAVLAAHSGVRQAVVVVRDDAGHTRLVAYVVPESRPEPGLAELRAFLAERLPEHMVPAAFVWLETLPLSPNGKVDRKALPAPDAVGRAEGSAEHVAPRNPAEQALATLWAEVLRIERVGVRDNFFELGGDSILSLQIVSRAARLGLRLTPRQIFERPTVEGLAALLAADAGESAGETSTPIIPILPALDPAVRERFLTVHPEAEDVYPLAPTQQGLLFHALREPGSDLYFQKISCVLRGDLDLRAFAAAWQRVLERHPILRTAFVWEGLDQPLQAVIREAEIPLVRREEADLAADRERGFDLAQAPLMRLTLADRGDGSWEMIWSHHHILLDGWSVPRVLGEVFVLYERIRRGDASEPEAPRPYRDFVDWLARQDAAGAEAFWRGTLAGFTAPTPLGVDRSQSGAGGGGERVLELPAAVTAGLRAAGRRHQVTLNTVLQGAWAALLARVSGEDDVVFGGVSSGRPADLPGADEMIGLFINTLPVRVRVEPRARLAAWLQALQERQLEQRGHEHTPLSQVQGWSDVHRGLPLFETILDFLNYPVEEALAEREESLRVESVRYVERNNYPLTLIAAPGATLRLRALFDRGRFDGAAVERLLGWLGTLLESMAGAGADAELWTLPVLSEAESRQVLEGWNDTAVAWDASGTTLHALVEAQVDRTPDAVAVVFEGQSLTYRELDEQANRLAHRLRRLGAGPGVAVGVCLERSAEMVISLLGVLKAGAAYLPLDPNYPRERVAYMVEDSGAPVVVARGSAPQGLTAAVVDWQRDREALAAESAARPGVTLDALALAHVIYTSGSTGRPKAVMSTHGGIRNRLLWGQATFGLTPADRVMQKTPFTFDVSVWEFFWPLISGARLVVARPGGHQDPEYLARTVESEGITAIHFVPSMLQVFVAEAPAERCASLRRVFCSGEALPFDLQQRFFARFGAELHNLYGPTEASVEVSWWACRRDAERPVVPIGGPVANTRLYVVDRELRPVPAGVAGELWLGGVQLARGYLGRPDLTAEKLVPDPFGREPGGRLYRTGDLVRWLPDGAVEYLGRIDHQVKVRGFRIELGEIEAVLSAHSGVRQAVVAVREDGGHKRLVAYAVPEGRPESRPETGLAGLRAFLAERLPEHMIPSAFVWLEALPLGSSGKVDRKALPAPDLAGARATREHVPPRTPAERTLAAIWAEVLRVGRVGVEDDFFELGGDSILSLQIVSRAGRAGLKLEPRQIFEHPTVAALAAVAGAGEGTGAEQGVLTGPVGLTPAQRQFFAADPAEPWHYNQAVLLAVRERPVPAVLDAALTALLEHHDALRLRFAVENGEPRQQMVDPGAPAPWTWIDLSGLAPEHRAAAFDRATAALQASLDLLDGPLLRAAVLDLGTGEPVRLLLVVHHLVVDGVSWRVLLEDLESASAQALAGRTVRLPAKTTSFRTWSEKLAAWAGSAELAAEVPFWTGERRSRVRPLPVDTPGGENTGATTASLRVELTQPETESLLREASRAYRTRVDELLLTALARAFARWTGEPRLLVELEGHGREEIFPGVDLSRTVGWFTSFQPVLLDLEGQDNPGAAIKAVKEQLRAIPRRGLGHGVLRHLSAEPEVRAALAAQPVPEVVFNYLGQLDAALATDSGFAPARESAGPMVSPRQERRHLVEINGGVSGGKLWMQWTWSAALHRRDTLEGVAARFLAELKDLLAHCLAPEAGGFTPSDFPLAGLDQARLDRLVAGHSGIEDIYPLAPTQQGLLFFHLYAPGAEAYVQQLTCGFRGEFDPRAFRRAWELAVDRTPVLRTSFAWRDLDEPLQVVHRAVSPEWHETDVRHLSPDERAARFEVFLREDRARGFDVERAPLTRFHLFRLGEEDWQLVWSYHHILLDGWSLPLLTGQVFGAYEALVAGRAVETGAGRPYRDYIEWLRRQDPAAAEAFWRETLAGLAGPTRVVGDQLPNREMEHAGVLSLLSEETTEKLKAAARGARLTVNTLVQGAWTLLLSQMSGQDEVVYGVTSSGRPADLPGVESIAGLFITTLPARMPVPADAPLTAWLADLQERQLRQRQFEHTPLAQIQAWSGIPASQPLFDSILVFENYPAEAAVRDVGSRLEVPNVSAFERTSYPLTVIVTPGRQLSINIGYDRLRLDDAIIQRALATLGRLLESMAESLDGRVSGLPLLSAAERQILAGHSGRATAGAFPGLLPVHEAFAQQAARAPERTAVVGADRELTYGELDWLSGRIASHLHALGVGPEVRVAVCLRRSCEMVAALLGVLEAGGVYVPIDPVSPRERIAFLLEDSGAAVLLTESELATDLPESGAALVCVDRDVEGSGDFPPVEIGLENPAYIIYTSGSTGQPKGVVVPHRALAHYAEEAARSYGIGTEDRVLQFASISFDASAEEIYPALIRGAALVLRSDAPVDSVAEMLRQIEEQRLTVLDLPTAYWHYLVAGLDGSAFDLPPSVRLVILGGEQALAERLETWRRTVGDRVELVNTYGPTEATIVSTRCGLAGAGAEPDSASGVPPIGRPIQGALTVVADHALRLVPPGTPGELLIGGAGLSRGYLGRPALTAERFVPDLFGTEPGGRLYRSGDRVRLLPDGRLEFLGRLDGQVKIRGFRIELGEIEAALARHPGLQGAAVTVRNDRAGDARLVAYVVPADGGETPASQDLRRFLAGSLPEYMIPLTWCSLAALPLNPSGKIDRKALPAPERLAEGRDHVPPRNPLEEHLAGIWREVLGVEQVGAHDDFFELGGHSLLAIQVVSRVRESLQVDLPLARVFEAPSIEQLALEIEEFILATLEDLDEEEVGSLLGTPEEI